MAEVGERSAGDHCAGAQATKPTRPEGIPQSAGAGVWGALRVREAHKPDPGGEMAEVGGRSAGDQHPGPPLPRLRRASGSSSFRAAGKLGMV